MALRIGITKPMKIPPDDEYYGLDSDDTEQFDPFFKSIAVSAFLLICFGMIAALFYLLGLLCEAVC
jgi:hypothetical protein